MIERDSPQLKCSGFHLTWKSYGDVRVTLTLKSQLEAVLSPPKDEDMVQRYTIGDSYRLRLTLNPGAISALKEAKTSVR